MSYDPRIRFNGMEIEEEVIGRARVNWDGKFVPYHESLKAVMTEGSQPGGDPTDPAAPFANDLHASVAEALGLEDYSELQFYTAAGSALDKWHGVDCLFVFRGTIMTIDVTVNPEKHDHKADYVLNVSDRDVALDYGVRQIVRRIVSKIGVSA